MIRTRFAPSPTGYLHLGSARTALLNYLYARNTGGVFILRIEDTDAKRSDAVLADRIIESLRWLGITWDEGPFYQSQRLDRYREFARRLLESGHAYPCFCTPEEIAGRRKDNVEWKYDKHCLNPAGPGASLTAIETATRRQERKPYVIRFNVTGNESVTFNDGVRGEVSINADQIEDFVLLKADGYPTYHLAVCVDDHLMEITDILRGEDHLTNTPKQVLVYRALGWQHPNFYHVPLIHGPDGKKLSKRHGSVDVLEYKDAGILSSAMVNYLSLLGWSPETPEREIFSVAELIGSYTPARIRKSASRFDPKKLESINSQHIAGLDDKSLYDLLKAQPQFAAMVGGQSPDNILRCLGLIKNRMRGLKDFAEKASYLFKDPVAYDEKGMRKHWKPETPGYLNQLGERFAAADQFSAPVLEACLKTVAIGNSLKDADLIHPLRLALTGGTVSPGIYELCEVLGRETVLRRLNKLP